MFPWGGSAAAGEQLHIQHMKCVYFDLFVEVHFMFVLQAEADSMPHPGRRRSAAAAELPTQRNHTHPASDQPPPPHLS